MCSKVFISLVAIGLAIAPGRVVSQGPNPAGEGRGKYLALRPPGTGEKETPCSVVEHDGIPFITNPPPLASGGSARLDLGGRVKRIFLLGMTPLGKPRAWANPLDYSVRYFVGGVNWEAFAWIIPTVRSRNFPWF